MPTNPFEFGMKYADLVETAWDDPSYLAALLQNPSRTLAAAGLRTIEKATVNIVLRNLDPAAKLSDQLALWEHGNETGVYDVIIPIKPEGIKELPNVHELDACCCCPCCCS